MVDNIYNNKKSKVNVNFQMDANSVAFIDEIAEKVERSRANFFIFAALKYAKELKSELKQEKGVLNNGD